MSDLASTLLLIPCCASKRGYADPGLPPRSVADLVRDDARRALEHGRREAWQRPRAWIDHDSELRPAIAYYTGNPYEIPGFRDGLVAALRAGLHCLIVSGGYGLLRPEEPIHRYGAHLTATKPAWRRRIPMILRDYVVNNGITRSFAAYSAGYADVVPKNLTDQHRQHVPSFTRGRDEGLAIRVVPERVGAAVVELFESGFDPGEQWERPRTLGSTAPARPDPLTEAASTRMERQRTGTSPLEPRAVDPGVVWRRITEAAGQQFHLKLGKPFRYAVTGGMIDLHTTNRRIPRSDIVRALPHVPFASTTVVNRLGVQGPSYVYAILMDPRVRRDDW